MNKQEIKEAFIKLLEEGKRDQEIIGYSVSDSDNDTITIVIQPMKEIENNIDTTTT